LLFSGRILTTTCHEEFAAFVKSRHDNISSRHWAMSLHFHTQREGEEEEEESAKDLKTLHRISKNLHRITMSRSPPLLLYQ
jgi:hypothetical protein